MSERIFWFGLADNVPPGAGAMVLGGKGAGLVEMARLGLPVPPGFIIPVGDGCASHALNEAVRRLRAAGFERFSVRSGAPVSMPGMMDTVLNLEEDGRIFLAMSRVVDSAQSARALAYKRAHDLPADMGTAVIVQAMVHGDKDNDSGTGVLFTRDPSTGKPGLFGEWLARATGEDLVSGVKTPKSLKTLQRAHPGWFWQLVPLATKLERHFKDMQDIEWTVENGKLWLLQTRTGKRTAKAAVRIALDMARESLIPASEGLSRITPAQVAQLNVRRLPDKLTKPVVARGMAIVPGVATGQLRGTETAGPDDILYTEFTEPKDYPVMQRVKGFITRTGGATSHAAVVARELGKPCVVGIRRDGTVVVPKSGHKVTMCGTSGLVVGGEHKSIGAPERALYDRLVELAKGASE